MKNEIYQFNHLHLMILYMVNMIHIIKVKYLIFIMDYYIFNLIMYMHLILLVLHYIYLNNYYF